MHKPIMLYNSDYEIVRNTPETKENKILPEQPVKPKNEQKVKKVETYKEQNSINTKKQTQNNVSVRVQAPVKNVVNEQTTSTVVKQEKKEQTSTQLNEKITEENEQLKQKVISWNEWRSNLQNKIMKDTRMPIVPEGTVFKFAFNVDKFGRINNIRTWSLSPAYTPYAIQYIAPVIKKCQGHDILDFPVGSERFRTLMEGGWEIANYEKFSKPDDFNDTEKILINR